MALILGSSAQKRRPLACWEHLRQAPKTGAAPQNLPRDGWSTFSAPGLFGSAPEGTLAEAQDHWMRHRLAEPLKGVLHFEGLATFVDIFINGAPVAQSRSMFLPLRLPVDLPAGSEILLHFQALESALKAAPRRARWRPLMIEPNGLRHIRTTALGSMDGWCPEGRPTGPYRAIYAEACEAGRLTTRDIATCDLRSELVGDEGRLTLSLTLNAGVAAQTLRLVCAGREITLSPDATGRFSGTLVLPGIAKWWPHTHGEPALHDTFFEVDGTRFELGKTGFRHLSIDRGTDGRGFGLCINGVPVFCRGAVWMTPDITQLPGAREAYAPLLTLAHQAGMNMLRVPGVGVYESDAFFSLCDALGILVFQDVMLANFDYPQADETFTSALELEVSALLSRTQGHASLAVLCGGSEVFQQAAMLGAPQEDWSGPVFDEMLPRLIAQNNPGLAYVPNSPNGGALPFVVEEGVAHYFGVGAYRRPLEDARRAHVRFASECLAFANVPRDAARMAEGIPQDAGADWTFADVREHYTKALFGDALPEKHHALAEATSAHVMETTLTEWRRPASPTRGALVLALSDFAPGSGWGVIDASGRPKAAYHGLKRAMQPLHLGLTDEGVNGLHLHLVNEREQAIEGSVIIEAFRGEVIVAQGSKRIGLAPRSGETLSAFALLGRFFDLTYAYRFGAREHEGVQARLVDAEGNVLAEAFHFPDMADIVPRDCGLGAVLSLMDSGFSLRVSAARIARFVTIESEGFEAADNGFHLAPGQIKLVALAGAGTPRGTLRALNAQDEVRFG